MKIDLVKIKLSQCDKYKYKPIKWCCNEMRNNPVTLFTNDDLVRIDDWIYHGYPQIINKLKNLHEKINKSDSISERTRLSKKEELLRDEIDKMYDLDEWTGENM